MRPSRPGRQSRRAPGGRRPRPGLPEPAVGSRLRPSGLRGTAGDTLGETFTGLPLRWQNLSMFRRGNPRLASTEAGGVSLRG